MISLAISERMSSPDQSELEKTQIQQNIITLARKILHFVHYDYMFFRGLNITINGLQNIVIKWWIDKHQLQTIEGALGRPLKNLSYSGAYVILIEPQVNNSMEFRCVMVRKTIDLNYQVICHESMHARNVPIDILEYVHMILEMVAGETEFEFQYLQWS